MDAAWSGLVNNTALLLALGLIYTLLPYHRRKDRPILAQIGLGVTLGGIVVAIMSTPWELLPGIVFDTRSVLLGTAGLFFGGIPTIIATLIAIIARWGLGGSGVWAGMAGIVADALVGLLWRYFVRGKRERITLVELYLFGIVLHVAHLSSALILPGGVGLSVLARIGPPIMLIFPVATAVLGRLMVTIEERRAAQAQLYQSRARLGSPGQHAGWRAHHRCQGQSDLAERCAGPIPPLEPSRRTPPYPR